MLVAGVSGIEVRICKPVFKSQSLACKFETLSIALKDYINICVGVSFPAFTFICPAKHAATFLITTTRNEITEFFIRVLRELCEVTKAVKGELITGLDTTEVKAGIVHRLIYVAAFTGLFAL